MHSIIVERKKLRKQERDAQKEQPTNRQSCVFIAKYGRKWCSAKNKWQANFYFEVAWLSENSQTTVIIKIRLKYEQHFSTVAEQKRRVNGEEVKKTSPTYIFSRLLAAESCTPKQVCLISFQHFQFVFSSRHLQQVKVNVLHLSSPFAQLLSTKVRYAKYICALCCTPPSPSSSLSTTSLYFLLGLAPVSPANFHSSLWKFCHFTSAH